jgi:hypothetical protein
MIINVNAAPGNVGIAEDNRGSDTSRKVSLAGSTVTIAFPANPARVRYSVYNDGFATIYLAENATVSVTAFLAIIPPGFYWKEDFTGGSRYLGVISVIAPNNASMIVSESSVVS